MTARRTLRQSWRAIGPKATPTAFVGRDGFHDYRVVPSGLGAWNVFVDEKPLRSVSGRMKRFADEQKAFAGAEQYAERRELERRQLKLGGVE